MDLYAPCLIIYPRINQLYDFGASVWFASSYDLFAMVVKSSRLTPLRQCSLPFRIQMHHWQSLD